MLRFIRYFLFIALFGTAFSLKATHNRAGEITYKWISGYTYSITLVTYTDDGPSIADRCKMTIHFGDGDSCVTYRQNGPLSPSTSECAVSYAGVIIKTNPNIKKNVYSCTHTYASTGLYKIYMFDRNRSNGVINIPNSVNQPFYIESFLTINAFLGPNNSSQLTIPPIDQGVLYKCFYHNAGAYDIDGDSLSYEIIPCKGEDAMGNIGFAIPGYSYPSPGATGSFSIDAYSGTLNWCTTQQPGEYNIAILIKEWRGCSGAPVLVGYVTRDMQVIVNNATNNNPLFSIVTNTCVQAGSVLTTTFFTSDPENNSLTITAYGAPFNCASPVASFTSSPGVNAIGAFNWNSACSNIRKQPYSIILKCEDNNSPVALSNFMTLDVTVIAPAPQNLLVTPWLNGMMLSWNKPMCHPSSGNKIVGYKYYRAVGTTTWTHSTCDRGIPSSSGYTFVGSASSENDSTGYDFTITGFPNGTTVNYAVYAVYSDCSESYASIPASNQISIGIDEKTKNNYSINVFPNPSSGIYNLKFVTQTQGLFSIELFDVNGRKIKHLNNTFVNGSSDFELNLKEFENGYYILKIESEEKNCFYKPIVKLD